jgi:hemerythrin
MALVNWRDEWDVGIASVDAQHHEMADILNELEAAVAAGASHAVTLAILTKLFRFTEAHFAHEQYLFRKANYPAADLHTRRHGFLKLILKRISETLESWRDPFTDGNELRFLRSWLMDHIRNDDQAFANYVREKATPLSVCTSVS